MNRPVLHRLSIVFALSASASGLALAGCDADKADPKRFEAMAQSVSAIPLSSAEAEAAGSGRRAAPLKVELLTPHELWDVRDGGRRRIEPQAAPAPEAGADVLQALATPARPVAPRPEIPHPAAPPPVVARAAAHAAARPADLRHVQLGAFSSEDGARAAWTRLSHGSGGAALSGLQPAYETIEVAGRRLVRLKVAASAERAALLCRDLAASDPWCVRSGEAAT